MSNTYKLQNMDPTKIVENSENCAFIADSALSKAKAVIYPNTYKSLKPQDQVLFYGVLFKNMLYKYLELLDIKLTNPELQALTNPNIQAISNESLQDWPTVSKTEYEKMPKRYRGIFAQKNKDNYILHTQDEPRVLVTVKKSDELALDVLLEHAVIQLSEIYRTKPIDIRPLSKKKRHDLNRNLGKIAKKPYFSDKRAIPAKFISNKKMAAIDALQKTFSDIDNITQLYVKEILIQKYDNTPRHGAIDIYNEYQNELTNKNRYSIAQNDINTIKAYKDSLTEMLNSADEKHRDCLQVMIENTNKKYQKVIYDIKNRTR